MKKRKGGLSKFRVVPLMPIRDNPHAEATEALDEMCRHAAKAGVTVFRPSRRRGSAVHLNRNLMIADLIQSRQAFTHVLFMDDDMTPPVDAITRMLAHNVDIVGALCTCRQDPPIPNARMWNDETEVWEELWSWKDGLVEVGAIGTGLMLISLHALQQVAEVYFQCLYEKEVFGMPEERAKEMSAARVAAFDKYPNAWWFRWLPGLSGAGENGEDISFCWLAGRYAGLRVHADTSIRPGHLGKYPYSIEDFLARREEAMERARKEGRLKVVAEHCNPIERGPQTPNNDELVKAIEEENARTGDQQPNA